ncbi:aryl-alcohol-oxidase from pleurotus Eryingii [Guyanagaster necrorhizus]|uniref:Aryl-alcohol-oxidase from pleurotus Eryingii n=1 Tax=Guyanagaster necrorhizus TaxID=856835 RepID=A0A9P8AVW6_9AGAR|nr:aryl-alcohol-oxidase from pleurotus Eryingii [Guyanagaster necrorhizus MCA 3950]KAG7450004.1 aryl-alcohol-oxidase from pleurotus Eryingii [Guyanagaster necrorhizus MCA 3950]
MFLQLLFLASICSATIYERLSDVPTQDFDYIIVGGGTAGNVLANRLTEQKNTSVLVLEAGQSTADVLLSQVPFFCTEATPNTLLDWNFTTTSQSGLNGRSIPYVRGFGLGGSSAVNYMTYTRGSSEDYDRYAGVTGDQGWGWNKMRPYILKTERFVAPADHHNTTGQFNPIVHNFDGMNSVSLPGYPRTIDERVIQVTGELPDEFPFNLDLNSGYHLGIGWHQKSIGNGTRSTSETAYLGPGYVDRENLHVLVHAYVTRILSLNDSNSDGLPLFNAVEFTQDAGATIQTLSPPKLKEIILSAGSLGTPHILLNSGVGDADELSALGISSTVHLPDVGKNLTDHPMWNLAWTVNDTNTLENVYWRNETFQAEALEEWQVNRTGFVANTFSNHLGFFRVGEGVLKKEPCAGRRTGSYELIFSGGIPSGPIPTTGDYMTVSTVVVCPLSRGNVTINSTDPLAPPVINPNFFSHPQDMTVMQQAVQGAIKFATAPVWEDYILGLATNITDLEGGIRNGAVTTNHPVSTASMSPRNAPWGVVDPDLKLKKAVGVRIVDASVLPFIPAGHTQAAVYAFAERAADLIRAD